MKYRYLVIMAQQRSGTHLLGSCIDSHPRIKYTGELFCRNIPQTVQAMQDRIRQVSSGDFDVMCLDIKYNQISKNPGRKR